GGDLVGLLLVRSRFGEVGAVGDHGFLDRLAEVVPQVPAVGDLDRVGCPVADGLGVGTGPVPAHDLHPGVFPQPGGDGLLLPVGQHVDRAAGGDVDEDGRVDMSLAD